jgi:tyrosinase
MKVASRRSFIAWGTGLGALTFAHWAERFAAAQGQTTRFDVATANGRAMAEKYARAVAIMADTTKTPEGSPLSWLFQWYTHAVNPTTNKLAEITRIYTQGGPNRDLAIAMWNTCQAHGVSGVPEDERMFLPWHRMYVYFLERIVRKVLADGSFTLPYWDYTDPTKRALPEQFRMPADPVFKALYRPNRGFGVNDGRPIDQGIRLSPINADSLKQRLYETRGVVPGFNADLDNNLHGAVHVLVGDSTDMGSIPWAANDPIFWLHHCNIDRFWASWNRASGANPAGDWLSQNFTFSDENGHGVTASVGDFVDTASIKGGGYVYDRLLPVAPTPAAINDATLSAAAPVVVASQIQPGPVLLQADGEVEVRLAGAPTPASANVLAAAANRPLFLVLRDLKASALPGVLYEVYLDPASGRSPEPIGTINFFDAVGHGDHGAAHTTPRVFSFDVTNIVATISADSLIGGVRIRPAGIAAPGANPSVGSVSLVQQ